MLAQIGASLETRPNEEALCLAIGRRPHVREDSSQWETTAVAAMRWRLVSDLEIKGHAAAMLPSQIPRKSL